LKGKENKTGGTRVGHRVQFWLGLALALAHPLHLVCFRRRRSLFFLASRLSHLSSEAVNASGSVRVRVSGRLLNTHALPQTCRWVPSDCLLHFPNHHPLHTAHCTALHAPRTFTCHSPRPRLCRSSSICILPPHLLYHPFHLRATVTRPPETAINPFDETAALA
jgi:hypothetical protein